MDFILISIILILVILIILLIVFRKNREPENMMISFRNGLMLNPPTPSVLNFTQIINDINMYATYYELFDVPDADLPRGILFLNKNYLPDLSEEIIAPVGVRNFSWNHPLGKYTANNDSFKKLPYLIKPIILNKFPLLIPDYVIARFQKFVWFKKLTPADIDQYLIAEGTYTSSKVISSKLSGNYFEVTKNMTWTVRLKIEYVYKPLRLGGISPYLTNKEFANAIHYVIPQGIDPNQTFSYYFSTDIVMSTKNLYIRNVANEPTPGIGPFDATLKQISMVGKPIDNLGRYSIVGHSTGGNYFDQNFFKLTLPNEAANILLGIDLHNKNVEFSFQENGIIIR